MYVDANPQKCWQRNKDVLVLNRQVKDLATSWTAVWVVLLINYFTLSIMITYIFTNFLALKSGSWKFEYTCLSFLVQSLLNLTPLCFSLGRYSSCVMLPLRPLLNFHIIVTDINYMVTIIIWGVWWILQSISSCRGETASGRSREARARKIARAGKLQAQDARAIKKARSEIKRKKTLEIYG